MSPDELVALAERVVDRAVADEQIEVVVEASTETEVRAWNGGIESFVSSGTRGIGIRCIAGPRQGFAFAGSLDADVIDETLAAARDNARFASPDDAVGLAAPDSVAPPAITLSSDALASVSPEEKIELVLEVEAAVLAAHPAIVGTESVDFSDGRGATAIVTSNGIVASWVETMCALSTYTLAADGDDVTTGFGFSLGRDLSELDRDAVVRDAVERAVAMIGAASCATRRTSVVFDPWVTAQFLGIVAESFSGTEVARGRSMWANRLGESIASPQVTLVDDPTRPDRYGATLFDAEGLAARPTTLIAGGVASAFLHDTYSARLNGAVSTASAVRSGFRGTPSAGAQAVALQPGTASGADIISAVGDGIFVTEVVGLHSGVNPVSGDFSVGIEGRVIRNGALAEPVSEVTIASTVPRMLAAVIEIGNDHTPMPLDACGVTLAIADLSLSGST